MVGAASAEAAVPAATGAWAANYAPPPICIDSRKPASRSSYCPRPAVLREIVACPANEASEVPGGRAAPRLALVPNRRQDRTAMPDRRTSLRRREARQSAVPPELCNPSNWHSCRQRLVGSEQRGSSSFQMLASRQLVAKVAPLNSYHLTIRSVWISLSVKPQPGSDVLADGRDRNSSRHTSASACLGAATSVPCHGRRLEGHLALVGAQIEVGSTPRETWCKTKLFVDFDTVPGLSLRHAVYDLEEVQIAVARAIRKIVGR